MKIKNTDHKLANAKIAIPIDGEIKLENGIADISAEAHELLTTRGSSEWVTGEDVEEQNVDNLDDQEGDDEITGMVASLTFDEVLKLAEDAKIPKYKMFAKNEKALRTYVTKKLHEADQKSEE